MIDLLNNLFESFVTVLVVLGYIALTIHEYIVDYINMVQWENFSQNAHYIVFMTPLDGIPGEIFVPYPTPEQIAKLAGGLATWIGIWGGLQIIWGDDPKKKKKPRIEINLKAYRINPTPYQTVFPVTAVIDQCDASGQNLHLILFAGLDRNYGSTLAAFHIQSYGEDIYSLGYLMNYDDDWRFNQDIPQNYMNMITYNCYLYKRIVMHLPNGRSVYRLGLWMPVSELAVQTIFNNPEYDVKCDGLDVISRTRNDPYTGNVTMIFIPVDVNATVEYQEPEYM